MEIITEYRWNSFFTVDFLLEFTELVILLFILLICWKAAKRNPIFQDRGFKELAIGICFQLIAAVMNCIDQILWFHPDIYEIWKISKSIFTGIFLVLVIYSMYQFYGFSTVIFGLTDESDLTDNDTPLNDS